jgi:transposase-like protein
VRVSAAEKLELIRLVEGSALSVRQTLREIGLPRSTFYSWYQRYLENRMKARNAAPQMAKRAQKPARVRKLRRNQILPSSGAASEGLSSVGGWGSFILSLLPSYRPIAIPRGKTRTNRRKDESLLTADAILS